MLVIGLLSSEEEAKELKFIAQVCTLEDRIHMIVRVNKLKQTVQQQ